jgi:hypothetical protein
MAFKLEKPVKDFLSKFQKDLDVLQSTIKKEGDDLVKKVKQAANKDSIATKRADLEKLVEGKLKRFEPAINKFVKDLNKNAQKAGVDLTKLEKTVRSNLEQARERLSKAGSSVKAKAGATKKKTNKVTPKAGKTTPKKTSAAKKASAEPKSPSQVASEIAAAAGRDVDHDGED